MQEKTVLVTGATGDIGAAVVREYAKQGYYVYIHYHSNQKKAEALLAEIKHGEIITFDMKNKEDIHATLENIEVEVLVHSAGIIKDSLFFFMEDEDWEDVISINLNALFYITKVLTRKMMQNRQGSIVNIASVSGLVGNFGQANYAASKGGVIAFTKNLALELGCYNIRVNALAPGIIDSEMIQDIPDKKVLTKQIPLGRFGEPEEVAKCAYFMGVEATYVSGEVLNISGAMVR